MKGFASTWIIVICVAIAVAANLLVYTIGTILGGSFEFVSAAGPATVDALTVAGFTAIPLAAGLSLVAALGRRWRWVFPAALVIAPLLEIGSILIMTIPAGFDLISALTLAVCHLVLVPISLAAIVALRSRRNATRSSLRPDPATESPVGAQTR
jgi:Family of unknown function (DUF6069)